MTLARRLAIFRGRRVLVTGHTGFKGSWLSLWLKELGADVMGYALAPEGRGCLFARLGLARAMRHRVADIRDARALNAAFSSFKPEFVFHLAAQSLVRASYERPKETFDVNVGGSVNLLEAVRGCAATRALVYVTTDKVYRNLEDGRAYREGDPLGGRDPYSASKAAAELAFSSWSDSFLSSRPGLGAASARAGNVLGGGDWAKDRIIPDLVRSLRRGDRSMTLRNPGATRPWQHVLEPLAGYLLLAERLRRRPRAFSGAWNFGPDASSTRTVRDLTERALACWPGLAPALVERPSRLHEAGLLTLDSRKSRRLLGWKPRWGFARTVAETMRWYAEADAKVPALDASRRQIAAYAEDA